MRVLLVNPPFYRLLGSHYNANSLGIAYIASTLNNNGHDAWLYNADFVNETTYKKLKGLFEGFVDYKTYFKNEEHEIWHEVTNKILEFKPDWIGYTSYTANITTIDIISRKVKKRLPKVKQVVGGVHATLDHELLNKMIAIDYTVRREGEMAMLSLVNGVNPKLISGVISRDGSNLINLGDADVYKDIDSLPFPERDKFWAVAKEDVKSIDVSYICSIRGCPYRCNYCASPQHWKRNKVQYRSAQSVIDEMTLLKKNYWDTNKEFDYSASANTQKKSDLKIKDNSIVYFVDDIFTVKKRRVKDILNGMIDNKLDMDWKCEARTDHLDEEICELMAKTNCTRVKLGFESGSNTMLRFMQKDEDKDQMMKGAKMLKEAGVPFTAYFMAGFPGETDEDLMETIEFAKEVNADYYSLSVVAPYFGTKMYYDLIDDGVQLDKKPWEYFFHQTGDLMANTKISKKVLEKFLRLNELNNNNGYI